MRLESRKYLDDIQRAANVLREFTAGRSFDQYRNDAMLRAAVERQFEIIGEAMARLARVDEAVAARISGYRRIIAFRNVLIHGYADVDDRLVWDVVETSLSYACGRDRRPRKRRVSRRLPAGLMRGPLGLERCVSGMLESGVESSGRAR
ncbi:MAG: DUF86 domain-containing protein [Acidimicrobiaceae bacterium]|nr:DUF86 domain-containing protein [Acidimicrobiaceae bacterium]